MKLGSQLEQKISKNAKKYLEKCRPNWDWPHTLAAVYWMRELIRENGGDERILLPAIYLHDIGYFGLFNKGANWKNQENAKPLHMTKGAELARQVLEKLDFKPNEIAKICQLVLHHDNYRREKDFDEQMIFEADCLGMIDRERAGKGCLSPDEYKKFLNHFEKDRLPQLKSKLAQTQAEELFEKAKKSLI